MKIARGLGTLLEGSVRALRDVSATANGKGAADARAAHELTLLEVLVEDFSAYQRDLTEPGFWAVAAHRLGTHGTRTIR